MSWSFSANGRAEKVRKVASHELTKVAMHCSNIPSEALAVTAFRDTVMNACDYAEGQAMKVAGSGSAWVEGEKLRSFSFDVRIEVIDLQDRD
jgi:hypothetical protein